jgi:hypothetical protein
LLIVVLYRQNHRWIEKPSVLFGGFLKNSINFNFSFKYYRRNHRRIEKSSVIVGGFWKLFMKLKIYIKYYRRNYRWNNLKILIFNYPSVKPSWTHPNKKLESPYFTRERLIYSSSSSSLYVKNINIYFFLFSSPPCSGMSSSSFFFYPLRFFFN